MTHEECWRNSLNRYLAIMDTRTDNISEMADEIIKPIPIDMPEEIDIISDFKKEE